MMNKPPIDELAKKTNGNKYILSILASKEQKKLKQQEEVNLQQLIKKPFLLHLKKFTTEM